MKRNEIKTMYNILVSVKSFSRLLQYIKATITQFLFMKHKLS